MELTKMTVAQAIALLRLQVERKGPDFVYRADTVIGGGHDGLFGAPRRCNRHPYYQEICEYVEQDENGKYVGSCIVGCSLIDAGMDAKRLAEIRSWCGAIPSAIQLHDVLGIPRPAARVFNAAQLEQDVGYPWGKALKAALCEAERICLETQAEG